jgi:fluoroacetyl-CoA thioesterase
MPVTPGMRGEASITVEPSHTGAAMGCGNVPTLSTSALAALLERAAVNAIRRGLEEGQESVGSAINLRHLAPTPQGKRVRAEAVVTAVNGKTVSFTVRAADAVAEVGEGTHERTIVDREQFVWSAAARGAGR